MIRWLLTGLLLVLSLPTLAQETKLTKTQMQEDLRVAQALLVKHHPNYGQHSPGFLLDLNFEQLFGNLPDEASQADFYAKLLPTVAAVRDGHTCLYLNPEQASQELVVASGFPLDLVYLDEQFHVQGTSFGVPSQAKILSIDGKPIEDWLQSLNQFACLDKIGSIVEFDFDADALGYYAWLARVVDGIDAEADYEVEYKTPDADELQKKTVPGLSPLSGYIQSVQSNDVAYDFAYYRDVPVLTINTFIGSRDKFEDFFDKAFEKLRSENAEDLVIDLRNNAGGQIGNASLLLAYLLSVKHNFPRYLHVTGERVSKKIEVATASDTDEETEAIRVANNRLQSFHKNWIAKQLASPRGYTIETRKVAYGKKDWPGKVHVLVSGRTFSAATLFVGELRRRRGQSKFYGSMTGGLDNRGCMRPEMAFILPNSRFHLYVPNMCHIQELDGVPNNFRPDIYVSQSAPDYFEGKDTVLDHVISDIKDELIPPKPIAKPQQTLNDEAAPLDDLELRPEAEEAPQAAGSDDETA